jgi:hypothetical protein
VVAALVAAACGAGSRPAPDGEAEIRIAVVADSHLVGTPVKGTQVYRRLLELIVERDPDVLLHLGDFEVAPDYETPWLSSLDTLTAYHRILPPSLEFLPCLGNHEGDRVGYAYALSALPFPEGVPWYSVDRGPVHLAVIENNTDAPDSLRSGYRRCRPNHGINTPGSPQRTWLEADLAATDADWRIVGGHRAYYGAEGLKWRPNVHWERMGPHALCETLESSGVDLVLSGDQHCYTRTRPIRSGRRAADGERGTVYVTCGGGGGRILRMGRERGFPDSTAVPLCLLEFARNDTHFYVWLEAGRDEMGRWLRGEAVDTSGVVFDRFELRK